MMEVGSIGLFWGVTQGNSKVVLAWLIREQIKQFHVLQMVSSDGGDGSLNAFNVPSLADIAGPSTIRFQVFGFIALSNKLFHENRSLSHIRVT